jgi:hypothetical protein
MARCPQRVHSSASRQQYDGSMLARLAVLISHTPLDHVGEPVADLPCRVRVLAHVQRRIQRLRTRTPRQQASQDNAWRETKSSSSAGVFHGPKSYCYLSQQRGLTSPASLF